jgi:hypothetical protein
LDFATDFRNVRYPNEFPPRMGFASCSEMDVFSLSWERLSVRA